LLMLMNSCRPNALNPRPRPDCLTPPKGRARSERTKSFTNTMPASICSRAMAAPRRRSRVKIAAPRPKDVWLAMRLASAASRAAIGIGEDEVGIAAREFEHAGLEGGAGEAGPPSAGGGAAGKGGAEQAGVGDEGRELSGRGQQRAEKTGGQTGVGEEFFDGEGA